MTQSASFDFVISVVLVRPLYASNVGAASRAMTNMGGKRLIIISPQCEIDYSAQQAAASGQDPLRERILYSSWEDFNLNEKSGFRMALTARDGRARQVHDLKSTLNSLMDHPKTQEEEMINIYLIFGPEDHGLDLSDIQNAHYSCSLPTFGENWSLNLAQAVMLALFIVRDTWGGQRTTLDGQVRHRDVKLNDTEKNKNYFPEKTLRLWIESMGFDLTKRRMNAFTVFRRMLLHNVPTQKELRIFETLLQQNIRRLKESGQATLSERARSEVEELITELEGKNIAQYK